MSRFVLASAAIAVAQAGTLSITYEDCGSKHGQVTGLSPNTVQTGSTATVIGTGTIDEDVTAVNIAATVSVLGTKLTDCSGDGTSDIVCTLPMGVGSVTVPALTFPLAKGTLSLPVVVTTIAAIPTSLANVDIHLTAEDQNGESAICLDVHTAASLASLAADTSKMCPSSPFEIHAQTYMEVSAFATCDMVVQEIKARIQANGDGSWADPHNGGHYYLDQVIGTTQLDAHRETGSASIPQGGPFRDNLRFQFQQSGGTCEISACSASQVQSVTDFSGGYCNLRNLFCGSDAGCTTQKFDFQFEEGTIDLSPGRGPFAGASADASMCIVPLAVEV